MKEIKMYVTIEIKYTKWILCYIKNNFWFIVLH